MAVSFDPVDDTIAFVKDKPILAGASFVGGGALAYGLSSHFLDFPLPAAIATGLAAGTGIILFEASAWKYAAIAKKVLDEQGNPLDPVDQVTKLTENITKTLPDPVKEVLGMDTSKFNETGDVIYGQHQLDDDLERERFHEWFFSRSGNKTAEWQAFIEAVRAKHGTTNFT